MLISGIYGPVLETDTRKTDRKAETTHEEEGADGCPVTHGELRDVPVEGVSVVDVVDQRTVLQVDELDIDALGDES